MRLIAASLCVTLLAGCASTTDVVPMGADTYTVGAKMSGPGAGWTETKQMALAKAGEHCTSQGKQVSAGAFETHGMRG